jgi:hypothetical protein
MSIIVRKHHFVSNGLLRAAASGAPLGIAAAEPSRPELGGSAPGSVLHHMDIGSSDDHATFCTVPGMELWRQKNSRWDFQSNLLTMKRIKLPLRAGLEQFAS